MFERRSILLLLVGLTICISIWRISVQEPSMLNTEFEYVNPNQYQSQASVEDLVELQQQEESQLLDMSQSKLLLQRNEQQTDRTTATSERRNNNNYFNRKSTITFTPPSQFNISKSFDNVPLYDSMSLLNIITKSAPESAPAPKYINEKNLANEDFGLLIDLADFRFSLNQSPCPRQQKNDNSYATTAPFILILVHSAPENYKKRLLIRETWGSIDSQHLRLIFLLGSVATHKLQLSIEYEKNMFSDLVQGNFLDAYKNMTYKHVMAFKWFIYNCPDAELLVKVDDDVFVNTLQLLNYIGLGTPSPSSSSTSSSSSSSSSSSVHAPQPMQKQSVVMSPFTPRTYHVPSSSSSGSISSSSKNSRYSKLSSTHKSDFKKISQISYHNASHNKTVRFRNSRNLLFCDEHVGSRVKRSYRSKWRVSVKEYAGRYYPPYCPGYSIIYSPDVVFRLYIEAQNSKYFWIDDVHITGTLAHQANITVTSSRSYILDKGTCELILASKIDVGSLEFLFAWPGISEEQIRDLWALNMQHFSNPDAASYGSDTNNYDVFR